MTVRVVVGALFTAVVPQAVSASLRRNRITCRCERRAERATLHNEAAQDEHERSKGYSSTVSTVSDHDNAPLRAPSGLDLRPIDLIANSMADGGVAVGGLLFCCVSPDAVR